MMNLGLGTAAIGRPHYINVRTEKNTDPFVLADFKKKGMEVLSYAYASGVRYFDTAPGYGIAEQIMLEWINQHHVPDIEIATKWGYTYTANFNLYADKHEIKEHTLAKLEEQWQQSRQLFPLLTTYQIHSATFESGVLENQEVLEKLAALKSQYNLHIGLTTSGDNHMEVLKAGLNVEVGGNQLFDAFQVTYNILDQSLASLMSDSITDGKRFIIKEGLANGRLFPNKGFRNHKKLYKTLKKLAKKYDTGIDAIALRFCHDTIQPFTVLSGAAERKHLFDNFKMNSLNLEDKDLQKLKSFAMAPEAYWSERKKLEWN